MINVMSCNEMKAYVHTWTPEEDQHEKCSRERKKSVNGQKQNEHHEEETVQHKYEAKEGGNGMGMKMQRNNIMKAIKYIRIKSQKASKMLPNKSRSRANTN